VTATLGDEKRARARIESSFDDRFSVPVRTRAMLLVRVLQWQRRVGASVEDVRTVTASLNIDDQETVDYVSARIAAFSAQLKVTVR
jgi:hypothetical protein